MLGADAWRCVEDNSDAEEMRGKRQSVMMVGILLDDLKPCGFVPIGHSAVPGSGPKNLSIRSSSRGTAIPTAPMEL